MNFLKYEGSVDPTDVGSLGNIFRYKNVTLNVYLTYSFGNVIRLDPVFKDEYTDLTAHPKEFINRWTVPGDEKVTNIPVIDNFRVVEWIIKRCEGKVDAVETPIGFVPHAEDINLEGLDFSIDQLKDILAVDKAAWSSTSSLATSCPPP